MKKKKQQKRNNWFGRHKIKIYLISLCVIAFFLRFYGLSQNLFFGPEQGIDLLKIKEIALDYNPVLVGAKTDIAGIFHGPIYYYLAVIPFLISRGDPIFIAGFFIAINSLSVLIIYKIASELYDRRVGIIASTLFAVSFGAISYSRWLSSHPLTIPLSCIFFLGIIMFLKGRRRYLFLASASFGLVGQAEFLNYLFFGVMLSLIIAVFWRSFLSEKKIFLAANIIILLFFALFNYMLFELRNNYIMTKSIIQLQTSPGYYLTVAHSIQLTLNVFIYSVDELFLPSIPRIGFIISVIGVFLVVRSKRNIVKAVMPIWFFTPIFLLIILRHDVLNQFFVYAIVPGILLNALVWANLISWRKYLGYLIFALVLFVTLFVWVINIPSDKNMFYQSTQPDINIYDQNIIIDKIYQRMHGEDFSFQSYTIPYWSQQGWEYLFWQRGNQKYGYLPVNLNGKTLFVIVQDDPSGKSYQDNWLKNTVPKWGNQVDSFKQGVFTVLVLKVE